MLAFIYNFPILSSLEVLNKSHLLVYSPGSPLVLPFLNNSFFSSRTSLKYALSRYNSLFFDLNGYYSVLHVKGIGFKVFYYRRAHTLYFVLGYNHIVKFKLSALVFAKVRKYNIILFSNDKFALSNSVYYIRHLRFPDPYRGKGVRYRFQLIKFKPGKQR